MSSFPHQQWIKLLCSQLLRNANLEKRKKNHTFINFFLSTFDFDASGSTRISSTPIVGLRHARKINPSKNEYVILDKSEQVSSGDGVSCYKIMLNSCNYVNCLETHPTPGPFGLKGLGMIIGVTAPTKTNIPKRTHVTASFDGSKGER
jgi:hypothetical protein